MKLKTVVLRTGHCAGIGNRGIWRRVEDCGEQELNA